MIRYPDGRIYKVTNKKDKLTKLQHQISLGNRGMRFEDDINLSNEYYIEHNKALITKRPTPIKVVKVDYTKRQKIVEAYFDRKSTTDYNGIYKGKYIDFEAKSTFSKSSFPLSNICDHQIEHLKRVISFGGIAFFIVCFEKLNKVFIISASTVINFKESQKRKSIPLKIFQDEGKEVKIGYYPRLNYLEVINEIFVI